MSSNQKSITTFVDLTNGETINKSQLANTKLMIDVYQNEELSTRTVRSSQIIKLPSYQSKFEAVAQPNELACIPTSAIMSLKYLSNVGRLTLYGSNLSTLAHNLHLAMSNLGSVVDSNAKSGLRTYTSNRSNCSRTVTLRSTYTYTPTVANWNTIKAEIDDGYPAIAMFKANAFDYDANHATTMIGYHTIEVDDYGNTANYAIVKDPGTTLVPEVSILWTTSNVYGYFILYLN